MRPSKASTISTTFTTFLHFLYYPLFLCSTWNPVSSPRPTNVGGRRAQGLSRPAVALRWPCVLSRQRDCFSALVRAISGLSDYAAMVISHNRLIGGKRGSPSCTALSVQLSARFSDAQKQLEIIRYSIRQLMQEDWTDRRARMRPRIWSQNDPLQTRAPSLTKVALTIRAAISTPVIHPSLAHERFYTSQTLP
jgi:hypothetical protein